MSTKPGQLHSKRNAELASAVLTNPATRISFRVGDHDARKLSEGFGHFGPDDLQNLGVGEAICRVERGDFDFNLETLPLPEIDAALAEDRRLAVLSRSRERYAASRTDVESSLRAPGREKTEAERREPAKRVAAESAKSTAEVKQPRRISKRSPGEPAAEAPAPPLGRGGRQHVYLQELIKRWAESRGWRTTIEMPVLDGLGSVDVALEKGGIRIACEVCVGSSPEQELSNVQKCLAAGFDDVVSVAADRKTLRRLEKHIAPTLTNPEQVRFLTPEELFAFLEDREAAAASTEGTVRGYRVKVRYKSVSEEDKELKRSAISQVIADAVKRLRRGDSKD